MLRRLLYLSLCITLAGCSAEPPAPTLRLAVTTSTRDSGLLEHILPAFEQAHFARVDVLAVGTGAALKLGAAGDVDVLICHAEAAELDFMAADHGTRREPFMENSFLILGPAKDPLGLRQKPPAKGLLAIREAAAVFVSRGDKSGTHQKELSLWQRVGGLETWDNYRETGQGQGRTLIMADQLQAYLLCDLGTYLKFRDKISLVPLISSGAGLENPYAVIAVNPVKNDQINGTLAAAFTDYLIAPATQRRIGQYQCEGQALFKPTRLPE